MINGGLQSMGLFHALSYYNYPPLYYLTCSTVNPVDLPILLSWIRTFYALLSEEP